MHYHRIEEMVERAPQCAKTSKGRSHGDISIEESLEREEDEIALYKRIRLVEVLSVPPQKDDLFYPASDSVKYILDKIDEPGAILLWKNIQKGHNFDNSLAMEETWNATSFKTNISARNGERHSWVPDRTQRIRGLDFPKPRHVVDTVECGFRPSH